MSFIFRRLSFRRRSKNGRSNSWPPGNRSRAPPPQPFSQPQPTPPISAGHETISGPAAPFSNTIDVYEDRIGELGQLMEAQGRSLDELANRSRRLSTENTMLRERLSAGMAARPSPASSSPTRVPLKNIMNRNDENGQLVKKLKDENKLLSEQAELLANELSDANKLIAERDASIASLGQDLSSCLQQARGMLVESKKLKLDEFEKRKEIETLQADLKRSNHASAVSRVYLAERNELEAEVADLGSQMKHQSATIESQSDKLTSMKEELEATTNRLVEAEKEVRSAKQEARSYAENTATLHDNLRLIKSQKEQLEIKLQDARDQLSEGKISQHKLQTMNDTLRAEVKVMAERHKTVTGGWAKGQEKIVSAMKEQNQLEVQSQQKAIDDMRRTSSSLEIDNARMKRDLQSSEHRCSVLEKLLKSKEDERRNEHDNLSQKIHQVTEQWEDTHLAKNELKNKITTLEEELQSVRVKKNENEARQSKTIEGLEMELFTLQEQNQAFSTRIRHLEDEAEQIQQVYAKEKQKIQQMTEHTVRDAQMECEALRSTNKCQNLKLMEKEKLLEKQAILNQSNLACSVCEKKQMTAKLEKCIMDEREVGKSLMAKCQDLNCKILKLTNENYQMNQLASKQQDQIYSLEKIIAGGEIKLSQFGKQLAQTMQDQERRIMKESVLKKELNEALVELEKMKRKVKSS